LPGSTLAGSTPRTPQVATLSGSTPATPQAATPQESECTDETRYGQNLLSGAR
tara:strand:+ start:5615 stop:5773 length:159 start_codon:yes stop_codon:yes gene_type:complete